MALDIGDTVYHREYGRGVVVQLGGIDPRWGQSYIVAFGRISSLRSTWCVFEDEVSVVTKG